MKIYTKTGDSGSTSLVSGERVEKYDLRVEAYGTVDELSAFIACLRDGMDAHKTLFADIRHDLRTILETLMSVQAALASTGTAQGNRQTVEGKWIEWIEERIDLLHDMLRPILRFTIPGGHPLVSLSHVCRTVCRRAERCAVRASHDFDVNHNTLVYLNRLSDYLYELGRKLAQELHVEEEYW
jgi:cob(I)alamin adenosyltransferase